MLSPPFFKKISQGIIETANPHFFNAVRAVYRQIVSKPQTFELCGGILIDR